MRRRRNLLMRMILLRPLLLRKWQWFCYLFSFTLFGIQCLDTLLFACSAKAAGSDAVYVEQVSPQVTRSPVEEPLKPFECLSTEEMMKELSVAAAHQASLVAQLGTKYAGEGSASAQKDEEIARLKAQLVSAHAEVVSTTAYSRRLADERLALMAEVKRERAAAE